MSALPSPPSSPRQLPRSRLANLVPSLLQSQALVALVPTTGELAWASQAAWDVARAARQADRRIALVDLWLEEPRLHHVVAVTPTDGIVDAFEYGVSLTRAAQLVDGVYFIAAGSATAHAADLLAQPRWRKLHAGFRSEGALLLLYLPANGLRQLSAVPDGVIALAPDGLDLASPIAQGIETAVERGATLLGVVRERWTPGLPPHSHTVPAQPPHRHASPPRGARPAFIALGVAAVALGAWALFASGLGARGSARDSGLGARGSPAHPESRAPSPEPLPWTVQLAAYGTLDKALAHADRLAEGRLGVAPLVTPVVQQGSRTVWYRVLAGAYATRDAAAAARTALWRRGVAPQGEGELLRAPYSFEAAAPGDVAALRARGVPAVRWGKDRVLIGAFETPEQAAFTETQLARAGVRASLIARVGGRRGTTP